MDSTTMSTALDAPIRDFLAHRRMLGRGGGHEEYMLRGVRNFLLKVDADDLDRMVFDRWCEHLKGVSANTRRSRQQVVHRHCLHRRRTDPTCFVPDPLCFAKPQPYREPFLVVPEQIARMLACASVLQPTPNSPLRRQVFRLAIVLLYTAGLRGVNCYGSPLPTSMSKPASCRCASRSFTSPVLCRCRQAHIENCVAICRHGTPCATTSVRAHRCFATAPAAGAVTPEPA